MRRSNCASALQYVPELTWLLFLRILDETEEREAMEASVLGHDHDALVGPGILDLIPDHADRVSVGKRSGRHSKDQQTIDEMLVEAALAGLYQDLFKAPDLTVFLRAPDFPTVRRWRVDR